jgi:hypothetical protein
MNERIEDWVVLVQMEWCLQQEMKLIALVLGFCQWDLVVVLLKIVLEMSRFILGRL